MFLVLVLLVGVSMLGHFVYGWWRASLVRGWHVCPHSTAMSCVRAPLSDVWTGLIRGGNTAQTHPSCTMPRAACGAGVTAGVAVLGRWSAGAVHIDGFDYGRMQFSLGKVSPFCLLGKNSSGEKFPARAFPRGQALAPPHALAPPRSPSLNNVERGVERNVCRKFAA